MDKPWADLLDQIDSLLLVNIDNPGFVSRGIFKLS